MLLFALRYEREGRAQTMDLLRRLEARGLSHAQLGLARTLLSHAGAERRTADLFSDRTFSSRFATLAKQSLRVRLLSTAPRLVTPVGMEGQVIGAGISQVLRGKAVSSQNLVLLLRIPCSVADCHLGGQDCSLQVDVGQALLCPGRPREGGQWKEFAMAYT